MSEKGDLHLTACLPWRPAKLRWLQCRVPNLCPLRLVWERGGCVEQFDVVFLPLSSASLSFVFQLPFFFVFFFMRNISDNYSRRWLGRHWEKKHYVCGAFNFSLPLHFFTSLSCEAKLIFHFSLWSESCLLPPSHSTPFPLPVLHPSYSLRLAFKLTLSWYSDIPPFRFGIAVNRVCEMEMRSLSLSLSFCLPLFPDIKTRLCLQCFSQILECRQIL